MQENISSQVKPTPPRRRNGRHSGKPTGQKMYASENDAGGTSAVAFGYPPQPFTPQKPSSATAEPDSCQALPSGSKPPRSRNTSNKTRAKNGVATSPESPRAARKTPPNNLPFGKETTAYAGSTFHASPAPSALPIPSFYSKGSTNSPGPQIPTPANQQQPSPPVTEPKAPTPSRATFLAAHDSPLEAMFRADRAEKEKARRASFAHAATSQPNLISPPHAALGEPNTMPRQYRGYPHDRFQPQRSASGIPLSELDGTPAGHVGPSFSLPYHERIRIAHGHPQAPDPGTTGPREDPSEALKRVLFGPKIGSSWTPSPTPSAPVTASTPPAARPSGVAEMEDSLRRILKLS